ncbi:MAG TPA: FAD binding domain-containing protein [Burkholderiaceae bacterium]|nr:FAD binding domain-containing protein [Burkholderiaceae bacterium]
MIAPGGYQQPARLEAALAALARGPQTVVAGGTDVYPACVGAEPPAVLLDISRLPEMRGIERTADALRIGATTTWSDLVRHPLPAHARALVQAARHVGGVQIQNRATIGGNLCNASPAADGVPPLLALDAAVELASQRGRRVIPLDRFVLGKRRTGLGADELLTSVLVPARSPNAVSTFLKLGHRRYLVISIVMVAVVLDFDAQQRVTYCGIGIGACSEAARRLPLVERGLLGVLRKEVRARAGQLLEPAAFAPLAPIDDVRATRAYRLDAVRCLVERALGELAEEAGA